MPGDDITLKDVFTTVGQIKGLVEGQAEEIKYLRADVAVIRQSQQLHGQEIASIKTECAIRGKRCSEEIKSLRSKLYDVDENTGVHMIAETTRWKTCKTIAAIALALVTLSATAIGIYNGCAMRPASAQKK